MKLTVIGSGYVGLVSGACFAQMGNTVTCIDIDSEKIEKLNQGIIPIYEPGLERMIVDNMKKKNIFFSTDLQNALEDCQVIFIAVGTPTGQDGSADLQYVISVAKSIGKYLSNYAVIVDK